jgi:hypothetical protein
MKLRRLMQLPVEDKAYQRAALCVTAKLARQVQRWVKRFRSIRHRHSPDVRFGPKATGLVRLGAESGEKREPVSDIDTVVVDSLKVLDPRRPIREADIRSAAKLFGYSMISSASSKNGSGILSPIALAVLRFTISS